MMHPLSNEHKIVGKYFYFPMVLCFIALLLLEVRNINLT